MKYTIHPYEQILQWGETQCISLHEMEWNTYSFIHPFGVYHGPGGVEVCIYASSDVLRAQISRATRSRRPSRRPSRDQLKIRRSKDLKISEVSGSEELRMIPADTRDRSYVYTCTHPWIQGVAQMDEYVNTSI